VHRISRDQATESLAQNKKLAFKAEMVKPLPVGLGDEQRLTQVLLNLVGNAIKFTDAGEVRVTAAAINGYFNVSVIDTPTDQQARIFEHFHQVDSSNTKAKGGTGLSLGLAIATQIVEMRGGRIWVESTLGKARSSRWSCLRAPPPCDQGCGPDNGLWPLLSQERRFNTLDFRRELSVLRHALLNRPSADHHIFPADTSNPICNLGNRQCRHAERKVHRYTPRHSVRASRDQLLAIGLEVRRDGVQNMVNRPVTFSHLLNPPLPAGLHYVGHHGQFIWTVLDRVLPCPMDALHAQRRLLPSPVPCERNGRCPTAEVCGGNQGD
jgi:hypothetical protein